MSNFADNIIDQNGQQVYLEDKHLNDQTSQTTVATTDAIMLKDTNGEYHSIDKASFNEAVRASLGSILTNFDKGSSITRIPGIDSNNDLGSVTAANLALVLGATKNRIWEWSATKSGTIVDDKTIFVASTNGRGGLFMVCDANNGECDIIAVTYDGVQVVLNALNMTYSAPANTYTVTISLNGREWGSVYKIWELQA